ncbi:MAG: CBS domain-containing protein [Rhodocyclaceae bacterium]|nr:CBS domain-containing protein [Rhodocyclaceae bacterium]
MSVSGTIGEHTTPLAEYPHVRGNATLMEVFAAIAGNRDAADQFRNVLVLDDADRLVGVLGLHDMLHALLPDYLKHQPTHLEGAADDVESLAPLWQEDCAEQCRLAARAPIGDDVTRIGASVGLGEPLTKAIYLFATHPVNVLPVVEDGRVVGVLRLVDVVSEVGKAVRHE